MLRRVFFRILTALVAMTLVVSAVPETPQQIAREVLAPLLDPVKVKALKGDRPANPRLYKILYWLETARRAGGDPGKVIEEAQIAAGYGGTLAAAADKKAILWDRTKLEEYGCFTEAGMAELRKGNSPTITKGPHAGDSIALDHVLPRAIVPELAARFYNLEAIPSKLNSAKSAKLTDREVKLARRWNQEKLFSDAGLKTVEEAFGRE